MRIVSCAGILICGFVLTGQTRQDVSAEQPGSGDCGWIGVHVKPMTAAFAESLGMVEPYGAIFERPEEGSPAADAGIEEGDVVTQIDGMPLIRFGDFATIISRMSPGTLITLVTFRNGTLIELRITLGSSKCPVPQPGISPTGVADPEQQQRWTARYELIG
jgi:serine protease Do